MLQGALNYSVLCFTSYGMDQDGAGPAPVSYLSALALENGFHRDHSPALCQHLGNATCAPPVIKTVRRQGIGCTPSQHSREVESSEMRESTKDSAREK